jgi:hypothetical protein
MNEGLLEVPIFTFGEGELLGSLVIEHVPIFGHFQYKFKGLAHAVLYQFLLRLLYLPEFIHQRPNYLAVSPQTELLLEPHLQLTCRQI